MSFRQDGEPEEYPRRWMFDDISAASEDPIVIEWEAPCDVFLEQITAHWSAVPTTVESLIVQRLSVTDPLLDTEIINEPAAANSTTDFVCARDCTKFRFRQGDKIRVDYPNSDDNDVGVEIILEEMRTASFN